MAVGKRLQTRENDSVYGPGGFTKRPEPLDPLDNQYKLYDQAIQQDAGDRDSIMQAYKQILGNIQPNINTQSYTPEEINYAPSSDLKGALANLQDLSVTGGLSTQDQQALRNRSMSPIRAIYANANREVDRSRRLSGGFAPNYIAAKSRMARNLTGSLDEQLNNVNASIADITSKNKISVAPQYAAFAENISNQKNRAAEMNSMNRNDAQKYNNSNTLATADANRANTGQQLQAVGGMSNLYGTSPALTREFGNAAQQASSMDSSNKARKQQGGMDYLRSVLGRY